MGSSPLVVIPSILLHLIISPLEEGLKVLNSIPSLIEIVSSSGEEEIENERRNDNQYIRINYTVFTSDQFR